MNSRPNFTDPWEAAKVSAFMEPAEHGRWKIIRFSVDERYAMRDYARAVAEGGGREQIELRAARTIPPGEYVSLQRLATPGELEEIESGAVVDAYAPDGDRRYIPVMSDTPTEIHEHELAIRDAEGDVVITGLGLGCIVSALLAKPEVDTITVVEIDRDVIALTGPYYADEPRVKIVNMDAVAAARHFYETGVYFDYAWHDIWSHIADRNLDDDDVAEHGISYERMFDAYSVVCDVQEAWAWHEALQMRELKELQTQRLRLWAEEFVKGDDQRSTWLLLHFHVVQMLPQFSILDDIPDEMFEFVVTKMGVLSAVTHQIKARGGLDVMRAEIQQKAEETIAAERNPDPMQRPNEVPEANVA